MSVCGNSRTSGEKQAICISRICLCVWLEKTLFQQPLNLQEFVQSARQQSTDKFLSSLNCLYMAMLAELQLVLGT
ncbi:hypothetical protein Pint_20677 [Pistacia integerrima]|uniref:Uncharacterized protein n=1 Tax=Pistacia integerrima TaxID=434235 RepID=A0ACC0XEJ1_9ROSI|nr:hypothetical protein Pint_20677 [Pistacia integerrima]